MSDQDDAPTPDAPAETPAHKALRLKQAAQAAKSGPPTAGFNRRQSVAPKAGASKPWMTR